MSETISPGGIIIPAPKGVERCWIKPAGEPAIILVETAHEAKLRIEKGPDALGWVVFHEAAYGHALWYPYEWVLKCSLQTTYKEFIGTHTTPSSIYAGDCPCDEVEFHAAFHAASRGSN